jgi:hypothetical protein
MSIMSFISFFRNLSTIGTLELATLPGSTYVLRSHMVEVSENQEARMVGIFYSMIP